MRLDSLLHGSPRRRNNLVIINLDLTRRHLVETLTDDSKRLTEFFNSAEVTIVAISVLSDWYIELDLVVSIVRGDLTIDVGFGIGERMEGDSEAEEMRDRSTKMQGWDIVSDDEMINGSWKIGWVSKQEGERKRGKGKVKKRTGYPKEYLNHEA